MNNPSTKRHITLTLILEYLLKVSRHEEKLEDLEVNKGQLHEDLILMKREIEQLTEFEVKIKFIGMKTVLLSMKRKMNCESRLNPNLKKNLRSSKQRK
jgi:hypothetical protein